MSSTKDFFMLNLELDKCVHMVGVARAVAARSPLKMTRMKKQPTMLAFCGQLSPKGKRGKHAGFVGSVFFLNSLIRKLSCFHGRN